MLELLTVGVVARSSIFHLEEMGQAESFENELCDFDFEGSVEEKRNFWVFMEGLNLCFDSFYGTFYSIKYSQTENLFHLLDEHIDALRLDCHL